MSSPPSTSIFKMYDLNRQCPNAPTKAPAHRINQRTVRVLCQKACNGDKGIKSSKLEEAFNDISSLQNYYDFCMQLMKELLLNSLVEYDQHVLHDLFTVKWNALNGQSSL